MFRVLAALVCSMILLTASLEALQPRLAEHYQCSILSGRSSWSAELTEISAQTQAVEWSAIEIVPSPAIEASEPQAAPASHFRVSADGGVTRTALWEAQIASPALPRLVRVEVMPPACGERPSVRQNAAVCALINALKLRIPSLGVQTPESGERRPWESTTLAAAGLQPILADVGR